MTASGGISSPDDSSCGTWRSSASWLGANEFAEKCHKRVLTMTFTKNHTYRFFSFMIENEHEKDLSVPEIKALRYVLVIPTVLKFKREFVY